MSTVTIRKRPIIISVIVILAMIGCFFSLMTSMMPDVKRIGAIYPALLGTVVAMRFISLVGIWHMKRWGAHMFVYSFLIRILLYILMANFSIISGLHVFFSIVYIILFFIYYRRMARFL